MAALHNDGEKQVMFIVGRMNPPTPGHIKGLCIPFLRAVRKKGLELEESPTDIKNLRVLLNNASVIPRIYLTLTTNTARIEKLSLAKQALYAIGSVTGLSESKSSEDHSRGVFNVKDTNLENPLDPEHKRNFVLKMLFEALRDEHEMSRDMNDDELRAYLDEIVICQPDSDLENCSLNLFKAMNCALWLSESTNRENLTIFMGSDEVEERKDICRRIRCVPIARTTGFTPGKKMSGSLIRFYAANENYAGIHSEYKALLNNKDIVALIKLIREGLRMVDDDKAGHIKRNKTRRSKNKRSKNKRSKNKRSKNKRTVQSKNYLPTN